jgi:hypothetical protein
MTRMLLAGTVLVLGMTALVQADEPAKTEDKKPAAVLMTDARLKEMLDNLGMEFTESKSTTGKAMQRMVMKRTGWTFVVYASVSPNTRYIWLSAPLCPLPSTDKARADILEKILQKNNDIGPIAFVCKGRQLYLDMPVPTENLKPVQFRKDLDLLIDTIRDTVTLWDPSKYPALPEPAKDVTKGKVQEKQAD